jgi:hypothetical protein
MNKEKKNGEDRSLEKGKRPDMSVGGEDLLGGVELTLEDGDVESAESAGTGSQGMEEDIIELTEMVEEVSPAEGAGGVPLQMGGTDVVELEPRALQEEDEIIELVDAAEEEPEPEGEEENKELQDLVAEQPSEEEEQLAEMADFSVVEEEPEDEIVEDEDEGAIPEGGPSIPGADETVEDVGLALEADESPLVYGTPIEEVVEEMPEADPVRGLSEEKIEEIITHVAREAVEKKADQILLKVAEAAIQKEIEKIKKLL